MYEIKGSLQLVVVDGIGRITKNRRIQTLKFRKTGEDTFSPERWLRNK